MRRPNLWSRIKQARLVRILAVYAGASWIILEVTGVFIERLGLPAWFFPGAILLLVIGLVVLLATAWVQSHPARAAGADQPAPWEVDLVDLKQSVSRGRLPHLTWARAILGGLVAFSLLFGFAGLYVLIKDRGASFAPGEAIASDAGLGIAVLPFSVSGAQLEEWREGMVSLLSTNLDGAAGLRAINSRTVLARWDELVGHAGRVDEATSLRVAAAAQARYALLGSAVGIGPSVRLTADVYDVESGSTLGQAQVEGSPDSVLALVDQLSIEVIGAILGSGRTELPSLSLASITTHSVPALKAYLEGEALFRRAQFAGAIPAYERAVSLDSTFALAYYRLSNAYSWKAWKEGSRYPLAIQNRERALALIDRLPEREALFLRIDAARASNRYRAVELAHEAVKRYPDDPEAWYQYGEMSYHQRWLALASLQETDDAFTRAVELDPQFASARIHGLDLAFAVADSALAAGRLEAFERVSGEGEYTRRGWLVFDLAYGDSARQAAARASLDTLDVEELKQAVTYILGADARLVSVPEELLAALERRGEFEDLFGWRAATSLQRGGLSVALAQLDESVHPALRTCALASLYLQGLPIPEDRLEAEVDDATVDTSDIWAVYELGCAAQYAAQRERWDDFQSLLSQLEERAGERLAEGDTAGARLAGAIARGARGFGEWRRGRPEMALELMDDARRGGGWFSSFVGDLQMELGRPAEAVRYYLVDWTGVPARYKLALAYEQLGEREKARAAYAYVVSAWADADPELQPIVEDAKSALERLASDSRTQ